MKTNDQKCLVLKSNQGNHTNIYRTWEVIAKCYDLIDAKQELHRLADYIAEKHNLDENERDELYDGSGESFEYDLIYCVIVTEDDYFNGIFDGGHYGYTTDVIRSFFEYED